MVEVEVWVGFDGGGNVGEGVVQVVGSYVLFKVGEYVGVLGAAEGRLHEGWDLGGGFCGASFDGYDDVVRGGV